LLATDAVAAVAVAVSKLLLLLQSPLCLRELLNRL
jgi:hypothetical protein